MCERRLIHSHILGWQLTVKPDNLSHPYLDRYRTFAIGFKSSLRNFIIIRVRFEAGKDLLEIILLDSIFTKLPSKHLILSYSKP